MGQWVDGSMGRWFNLSDKSVSQLIRHFVVTSRNRYKITFKFKIFYQRIYKITSWYIRIISGVRVFLFGKIVNCDTQVNRLSLGTNA
jgi:hypothetical protein